MEGIHESGTLITLLGCILAGGGAYIAWLGGSSYYVVVGAMLVAAGYLMIKGRIAGFYTYVGAFAFTAAWSFWEVGLSGGYGIRQDIPPDLIQDLQRIPTRFTGFHRDAA